MTAPLPEDGPPLERFLDRVEREMYRDLYEAAPPDLREALGIEVHAQGSLLRLTVRAQDHPFLNRVMGFGEGEAAGTLDALAHHYRSAGIRRWMVQVPPHLESTSLREACDARGLVRHRGWAKHVAPASLQIPSRSDLQVVEVDPADAAGVDAWAALVVETFALAPELRPWYTSLAGRERWRLYLAPDGDEPAAAAALYLPPPEAGAPILAQLNFAGTRATFRNRGAQSALIARRFEDARALGVEWIVTETDEELPDRPNPSYHNMVRLGLPVRYVRANLGPPKSTT